MKNYLIIIGSLLLLGCHSNYTYRKGFEKAWNPDLVAEKSTRSYEKSALAKTEAQKTKEVISANNSMPTVSIVSKDTLTQKVTK